MTAQEYLSVNKGVCALIRQTQDFIVNNKMDRAGSNTFSDCIYNALHELFSAEDILAANFTKHLYETDPPQTT